MVLPSLAEGFGFPIVEMLAGGTHVVTSNSPSVAEIARSGARLVDPTDSVVIAVAGERLVTDSILRATLSQEAELRSRHLTWEACAARNSEAFERVAVRDEARAGAADRLTFGGNDVAAAPQSERGSIQ